MMISLLLTVNENYDCAIQTLVKKYDRAYAMHTNVIFGREGEVYKYDRSSPLIFISGVNLSGSELLRDILDSHPDIRCNSNSHLIGRLLRMQDMWFYVKNESVRLQEAGISRSVMDAAVSAFTLELMSRTGEPSRYLCNQDLLSVKYADHLSRIFPQAKFFLVVRDPLHYAYTKLQDHNITRFNKTLFIDYLKEWDQEMLTMKSLCGDVSMARCRLIHYESLFLRPRQLAVSILKFINSSSAFIPETILAKLQPGTNDALQDWYGFVPRRTVLSLGREGFHMVSRLGYAHLGYPPNYHFLYDMIG